MRAYLAITQYGLPLDFRPDVVLRTAVAST